jgi:Ran GTPase-activating protein (RanGAP) involved in mRNA processing and transport
MIRSGLSVGRNTTESSLNDQLRRYKPRSLEDKEDRLILDLAKKTKLPNPAHESLQDKCINLLVANFVDRPIKEVIPPAQMAKIVSQLPTNLPPIIGASYIFNENYWKKCCIERFGWQNCKLEDHGLLWKQMYFEKILQEILEDFDPLTEEVEEIYALLEACADYIFTIRFTQLPSHLDLCEVSNYLPNLTKMDITYGVNKIGMNYERMLFGLKISDATALAKCFDRTDTLTTLIMSGNMIDDDLLRMLMTGLIKNNTITHIDMSHNKVTNHGARLLSKLLGDNSVITTLNLCDNALEVEAGRYLARGLRENDSLLTLNLRLNRLGDDGSRLLFEGLQDNLSLTELNLSSNGAGAGAAQAMFSIIRDREHRLASLDISGNDFIAEHFELMKLSIAHNQTLIGLDMRGNPGYEEATVALEEIEKVVHTNEFYTRGKLSGNPRRL